MGAWSASEGAKGHSVRLTRPCPPPPYRKIVIAYEPVWAIGACWLKSRELNTTAS